MMPPQHHLCNGLARPPDYSIVAREWTLRRVHVGTGMDWPARTACWPTAIVGERASAARLVCEPMLPRDRHQDGQQDNQTVKVKM